MPTLSGCSLRFALAGVVSQTLGGAVDSMTMAATYSKTLTDGTVAGAGNSLLSLVGTVTAGTPVDIDLQAVLNAGLTDSTTLTNVKCLMLMHTGTVTGRNLQIGDSTGTLTNAWVAPWLTAAGGVKVGMGGAVAIADPDVGYTVDGTHKVLRITSSLGAVPYQIDIIGVQS